MNACLFFINYLIASTVMPGTLSAEVNPLNGQHLRVLTMEFPVSFIIQRNATGHIINSDGVQKHMIEALSQMLNFRFSYLPIVTPFPDDTPSTRGGISYLVNDEADYYMTTSLATSYRLPKVDYPAAWYYGPFSTLLPYPKETINLSATFEPFSYEVWILIAISIFSISLFFKLLFRKKKIAKNSNHQNGKIKNKGAKRLAVSSGEDNVILDVIGNLVSQGQHNFPKRLAIRIAAGAWCCACFFLVQIYCSTLTSHITSPNQKPLVNSFFEIADTPGVSLTVDRGYAIDKLMQITESSSTKRFVEKLQNDGRLITCNITSDCLDYVKLGKAVYSAPYNSLSLIIAADLKNSSSCHYTRTRGTFWNSAAFTMLRKNSPYTETMNKGILRLQEAGLLAQWEKWYIPPVTKCTKINERTGMPRLSIKHLSSAFVILIAGYLLSLSVFLAENLISSSFACWNRLIIYLIILIYYLNMSFFFYKRRTRERVLPVYWNMS